MEILLQIHNDLKNYKSGAMRRSIMFYLLLGSLKLTSANGVPAELCDKQHNSTFFCEPIGGECHTLPCNVTYLDNLLALRAIQEQIRSSVIEGGLEPEKDGEAYAFKFIRQPFRECNKDDRDSESSSIKSIRKIFRELDVHAQNVSKLLHWAIERRLPVVLDVQVKPDQSSGKSPVIWVDSPNLFVPVGRTLTYNDRQWLFDYIKKILTIEGLEESFDDELIHRIIDIEVDLARLSTAGRRIIRALTFRDVPELFNVSEAVDLKNLINSVSESLDSSGYVDENSTIIFNNFWYIYFLMYTDTANETYPNGTINEQCTIAMLDVISEDPRLLPMYIKIHYLHKYGFHLHKVYEAQEDYMDDREVLMYPLKELCLNLLESTVPEMVGQIYINNVTSEQNHIDRMIAKPLKERIDDQEFTLYALLMANNLIQNHSSDFKPLSRNFSYLITVFCILKLLRSHRRHLMKNMIFR